MNLSIYKRRPHKQLFNKSLVRSIYQCCISLYFFHSAQNLMYWITPKFVVDSIYCNFFYLVYVNINIFHSCVSDVWATSWLSQTQRAISSFAWYLLARCTNPTRFAISCSIAGDKYSRNSCSKRFSSFDRTGFIKTPSFLVNYWC